MFQTSITSIKITEQFARNVLSIYRARVTKKQVHIITQYHVNIFQFYLPDIKLD